MGQGGPLVGGARGSIVIDVSQVEVARNLVRKYANDLGHDFDVVSKSVKGVEASVSQVKGSFSQTQTAFAGLAGAAKQVAAAFGIGFGIAGVVQLSKQVGQFGLDTVKAASDLTESTNKINVAFESSGKAVLDWSKNSATALGMSRRQALEAASSFGLLFSTMGLGETESAKMSERLVQLAADMASINNISPDEALQKLRSGLVGETEPLRAVGVLLDDASVKAKAMAMGLATSADALTQQDKVMARYQLILEQTSKTQGDFARTSGELANQQRKLAANIEDSKAAIGKTLNPGVGLALSIANAYLERQLDLARRWGVLIMGVGDAYIRLRRILGQSTGPTSVERTATARDERAVNASTQSASVREARANAAASAGEARAIHLDWARGVEDVNRQMHEDIIDEETSYGQQRAKTVADYARSVSRADEDFGRQRLRAEIDQLDAIQDVLRDATRREQGAADDLARSLARSRADAGEREIEIREDATKRLSELDENYEKERIKRAKDLSDDLLDAAGHLDAKQVYELQRNAAKQEQEAKEQHDDAREKIQAGLDERLDDERKNLDKSIRQQQDAYDRQIEQGREADRLRLEDMAADFIKRKAREDEDRTLQTQRRAQDYALQLAEMDTQHGLRLNQIRTHAIEERNALQVEADAALVKAQVADEATRKRHEARELEEEKLWDKFHKHIGATLGETTARTLPGGPVRAYASGGYVPNTGLAFLHAGEYVMPRAAVQRAMTSNNSSRSISVGDIHISGTTNMGEAQLKRAVISAMTEALEAA